LLEREGQAAGLVPGITIAGAQHLHPNFARDRHHEIEYDFSGRRFYADRSKRGAYSG